MTVKKQNRKELVAQALKIRTNLYQASHGDFANLPDYYAMSASDIKDTTMAEYSFVVPACAW